MIKERIICFTIGHKLTYIYDAELVKDFSFCVRCGSGVWFVFKRAPIWISEVIRVLRREKGDEGAKLLLKKCVNL